MQDMKLVDQTAGHENAGQFNMQNVQLSRDQELLCRKR